MLIFANIGVSDVDRVVGHLILIYTWPMMQMPTLDGRRPCRLQLALNSLAWTLPINYANKSYFDMLESRRIFKMDNYK